MKSRVLERVCHKIYQQENILSKGLSKLYGLGVRWHQWLYQKGILPVRQPPCRVIGIGNLTVGGTGKTPITRFIAKVFHSQGYQVAVVVRGYKASSHQIIISDGNRLLLPPPAGSDEGVLLATGLKGIAILQSADRYQALKLAVNRFQTEVAILDDAFQHYGLKKDLQIVLLDARAPFGNGHLLPRGSLREPIDGLKRADAVIFTKGQPKDEFKHWLQQRFPHLKLFESQTKVSFPDEIKGQSVIAFCGIAKPQDFYETCVQNQIKIKKFIALADHQRYDKDTVLQLLKEAQRQGVKWLVTTEKDAVKMFSYKDLIAEAGLRLAVSQYEIIPEGSFESWLLKRF